MNMALSVPLAPLLLCAHTTTGPARESALKCLQRPIAFLVGQQTRIVIDTPADCRPA